MSSFWKDYSEYIVSLVSIPIGFFTAYWIFLKEKKKKELSYEVLSNSNIITVQDEFKDDVEVTFKGKKINNLWLILVKFTNTGNTPIESKDFDRPISLIIEKNSKIFHFEYSSLIPSDLPIQLDSKENAVVISPLLLNMNDSFVIQLITAGESPRFSVNTRISGIEKVFAKSLDSKPTTNSNVLHFYIVVILCSVLISYFILSKLNSNQEIYIQPIELLDPNIVITEDGIDSTYQVIRLFPSNGVVENSEIYFRVNMDSSVFVSTISSNGMWEIPISKIRPQMIQGYNFIRYKFNKNKSTYRQLRVYFDAEANIAFPVPYK